MLSSLANSRFLQNKRIATKTSAAARGQPSQEETSSATKAAKRAQIKNADRAPVSRFCYYSIDRFIPLNLILYSCSLHTHHCIAYEWKETFQNNTVCGVCRDHRWDSGWKENRGLQMPAPQKAANYEKRVHWTPKKLLEKPTAHGASHHVWLSAHWCV